MSDEELNMTEAQYYMLFAFFFMIWMIVMMVMT